MSSLAIVRGFGSELHSRAANLEKSKSEHDFKLEKFAKQIRKRYYARLDIGPENKKLSMKYVVPISCSQVSDKVSKLAIQMKIAPPPSRFERRSDCIPIPRKNQGGLVSPREPLSMEKEVQSHFTKEENWLMFAMSLPNQEPSSEIRADEPMQIVECFEEIKTANDGENLPPLSYDSYSAYGSLYLHDNGLEEFVRTPNSEAQSENFPPLSL
jgi:hypothetical protein